MVAYSNEVSVQWVVVPNQPPVVSAGANQTITLPTNTVTLNGTATDDGLPSGTLLVTWSLVSGPAAVTFATPNAPVTQATFPISGTYVLRLSASDTQFTTTSDVTITVNPTVVGDIEVCYFCPKDFGFGQFQDGPTFVIRNTSTNDMVGGILRAGPGGGVTPDSFNVGAIPAGGRAVVAPGLSNDGATGHTFFTFLGSILDTSDAIPNSNDTQFEFTAIEGAFQVDSSVFTPAATQGVSEDGTIPNINFLGGPGDNDGPCFGGCFDKIVATLTLAAPAANTPVLVVTKTHGGNFTAGQLGASYTLTVSNVSSTTATSGAVTVWPAGTCLT